MSDFHFCQLTQNRGVIVIGINLDDDNIGHTYYENIRVIPNHDHNLTLSWSYFVPGLRSPAYGNLFRDSNVTFEWTSVTGATAYDLEVYLENNHDTPLIKQYGLTDLFYTPDIALNYNSYDWRVRSRDVLMNASKWTDFHPFAIIRTLPSYETGTVTGVDGNIYQTVKIGDQWWMAENLKTTRYRNGDSIPVVTNYDEWNQLTTGARCVYENTETYANTYGYIYNWYSADDPRGLAPEGWRVPTDRDWKTLVNYLGGRWAGGQLKETGTSHWRAPNTGATNESGFTALPGGFRYEGFNRNYDDLGRRAMFWSSTSYDGTVWAWHRLLYFLNSGIKRSTIRKHNGLSIRLVREY